MEIRGEFRFGNGRIVPNNVTLTGRTEYLKMLFHGVDGTQVAGGGNFFVGLCQATPSEGLVLADLIEPTPGISGYNRIAVTRDTIGWPNSGVDNGIPFVETADLVFAPNATLDNLITRVFLTPEASAQVGEMWALGAAFSASPVQWDENTPLGERTVRYRQYLA